MSHKTLTVRHTVDGVLTDYSDLRLSDPTGTFGVEVAETHAVVVADATAFSRSAPGVYVYTIENVTPGVLYRYWIERTYNGETKHDEHEFTLPAEGEATLFVPSKAELQARLRLSGTRASDALVLLDEAIQTARVGFYDALGAERVEVLRAIPFTIAPQTAEQALRVKAAYTEVNWVRLLLLRRLPVLFMETAGNARQAWNEEGLARQQDALSLEKELERLWAEIQDALEDLKGTTPDNSNLNVATIGPLETPPRPGASLGLGGQP